MWRVGVSWSSNDGFEPSDPRFNTKTGWLCLIEFNTKKC